MVHNASIFIIVLDLIVLLRNEGYLIIMLFKRVKPLNFGNKALRTSHMLLAWEGVASALAATSRVLLPGCAARCCPLAHSSPPSSRSIFLHVEGRRLGLLGGREAGLLAVLLEEQSHFLAQAQQRDLQVLRHGVRIHFNCVLSGHLLGKGTLNGHVTVFSHPSRADRASLGSTLGGVLHCESQAVQRPDLQVCWASDCGDVQNLEVRAERLRQAVEEDLCPGC